MSEGYLPSLSPNTWNYDALEKLCRQLNSVPDPQRMQDIESVIQVTELYSLRALEFLFDQLKLDDVTLSTRIKHIEDR